MSQLFLMIKYVIYSLFTQLSTDIFLLKLSSGKVKVSLPLKFPSKLKGN